MIYVENIKIQNFRGIRNIELKLRQKNFAVCGPNGTGKSGVVDALEFALTGNISRLSGRGTGELSVTKHGPHVDTRDNPGASAVTLDVYIPSLKKSATIQRNVKSPRTPIIFPKDEDVKSVFDQLALHPEFVLSRRELIRYVLSEPGERAKEVQALLKLDDIEKVRATLQRIANASDRELRPLTSGKVSAERNLATALSIPTISRTELLNAANERRTILSLPPLSAIDSNTSLKDGLATSGAIQPPSQIPKLQALADVQNLRAEFLKLYGDEIANIRRAAIDKIDELSADAILLEGVTRETLLRGALALFDNETCPVCDTPWEAEEFRKIINGKLERLAVAVEKRHALEECLAPITSSLQSIKSAIELLEKYVSKLPKMLHAAALDQFGKILKSDISQLIALLPLEKSRDIIENLPELPPNFVDTIDEIATAINALPEPTHLDAARDYLIVGQDRLETYREAQRVLHAATLKAEKARTIFALYGEVTTNALKEIYKEVEKQFQTYYRSINQDDEGDFEAKLTPSLGKLGFDVDFYGRGFFPPGAYHSEGHQDGMGVCLYLALMKDLLGSGFTVAVLDDVLMSVDSGHRREVCQLLKTHFPNTQFILTTHDEIWLKHMGTTGLIGPKAVAHFRTWNVEKGPSEWDDNDIWDEIARCLERNDVPAAAANLRHYLEHMAREICHVLRVSVEFRGDARFTLGDLLPNAVGEFIRQLKAAKAAAESWGKIEICAEIEEREKQFRAAATSSNVEQWQMNAAIHYNEWANLQRKDFEPVVNAFRKLCSLFRCENCGNLFYIMPVRGPKEAIRCDCGTTSYNLKRKSAGSSN